MKSILVIDDDQDIREVIEFALTSNGHKVIEASSGEEGLEILTGLSSDKIPGLIIVDYLMPGMDGITFIETIRKKFPETLGKIPLAISSAMGPMDQNIARLNDVWKIFKPIDLEDLLRVAKRCCS